MGKYKSEDALAVLRKYYEFEREHLNEVTSIALQAGFSGDANIFENALRDLEKQIVRIVTLVANEESTNHQNI